MNIRFGKAAWIMLIILAVGLWLSRSVQAKRLDDFEKGMDAFNSARYQEAVDYLRIALTTETMLGNSESEALCLRNIGAAYGLLCEYEKALSYYGKALEIFRRLGDIKNESRCLMNIGLSYKNLWQYAKALSYYTEALAISRRLGDLKGEGGCLLNIGTAYNDLCDDYEKALSYYGKALEIFRKLGDVKNESRCLLNIGISYSNLCEYEKALSYYAEALAISRRLGDLKTEGNCLNNVGVVYAKLGQHEKALSHYGKALKISRIIRDKQVENDCLFNICEAYDSLGQHEKAFSCLQNVLSISRTVGDLKGEVYCLIKIGDIYRLFGQNDKALSIYQKALAITRTISSLKDEAHCLFAIGTIYANSGSYHKSISCYKKALAIQRKLGYVIGEMDCIKNIGLVTLLWGEFLESDTHFDSVIKAFEAIRGHLKTDNDRESFQANFQICYCLLAAARLAQGNQRGAFEVIERGRSKSFLDLLGTRGLKARRVNMKIEQIVDKERQISRMLKKHVELASAPVGIKTRSALKAVNQEISGFDKKRLELIDQLCREDPELGALMVVDPPKLKEIQSLISDGTALVEFFHPGELNISGKRQNQLWVFVVRSKGLEFEAVDVPRFKLEKTLNELVVLLSDESSDREAVIATSHKLYQWLIRPIEPILERIRSDTLVFVPWGPMFKIPFSTLAPEKGESLLASRNIVTAPSAGVYRFLKKKQASGRKKIFAIGNPDTALIPLLGAEQEVMEISGMFRKSMIRTRGHATESIIKSGYDALGNPDVVHFACHGIFNEKVPQLSHLALTPDQKNDGNLEMHEIFGLDWKGVSLVTLSSCSSGKGKLGAGNDLIGLTRGFMFAGAPAVLCSLWDVDDEATRALMKEFYSNYLSGMSKPRALRKAQESIKKMLKWSHPYYWSAFVLFGNWE
jgi:CHAT domain-containing protein